jgi:hypothetical protein
VIRNEIVILIAITISLMSSGTAQEASQSSSQKPPSQPQVKINVLNVCTPSHDEQQQITSALSRIPKQPLFSPDFEVDRGRSTLEDQPTFLSIGAGTHVSSDSASATWVRIRREFGVQALFSTVQYSFSQDPKSMTETVVFRVRDPKDLLEVSVEDSASAVTTPSAMLGTNTPVSRIRLERFGKSSIVLARCEASATGPAPDQSAYEPLFQGASSIVANYRNLLSVPQVVPEELDRVAAVNASRSKIARKTAVKKPGVRKAESSDGADDKK